MIKPVKKLMLVALLSALGSAGADGRGAVAL
ncbi:endo-b1,4-mannanase 5C [Klebsiella michiganensis]|uniref:Endo-b1,4-mannanase 5C n=1 Tax=Klebsiella michiganensis TaxID=1134687 RepID=A0A7H4PMI0_9ENTR|nr:endo-b1,4-mannanase 5C [Klebsiella michiganensis]